LGNPGDPRYTLNDDDKNVVRIFCIAN
jgi:hypothetical protein